MSSHMVREFHQKFGLPVLDTPALPSQSRCDLRVDLIKEEFTELRDALEAKDIVEVADALADLHYVIHGAALEFGIPLDDVIREVHRSNMSKMWAGDDGPEVRRRADGKVLKPPTYSPADIRPILVRHGALVD